MIALLSVAPPLSPRAIQARNAFSRRSRRDEYCRNGSTLERDSVIDMAAGKSARVRGLPRGGAHIVRQAREIRLALEFDEGVALVRQHILAEGGAERGEPLADRRQPILRGLFEMRAGAAETRCDSAPARAPARR